ncbi:hypothetical protein F5B19DRAFT_443565 [Rostrohypoxylon terebratum]|nr:hypothetical protein F5B19DRAFT_443565 [Rostrohypoxylon terebratum]
MSKINNSTELSLRYLPNAKRHGHKIGLLDLPHDIFFLICSYLSSQDCVLCRRVSRSWLQAFSNQDISWTFMKLYFPRCLEMRRFAEAQDEKPNWNHVFANVARRYYYLRSATPRLVEKIDIDPEAENGFFYTDEPVRRYLTWNNQSTDFQHPEPTWTMDCGLLIYAVTTGIFIAYDLETEARIPVPFRYTDDTVIRRIRLACGVLIIEWFEGYAFAETELEKPYPYYATAFDVVRKPYQSILSSSLEMQCVWDITFRSEWKNFPPGFSAADNQVFYSAHTSTHYVLYSWIDDPTPRGNDDPQEELIIWDISKPSSYRASLDPTGINKPRPGSSEEGPVIINKISQETLVFIGLGQTLDGPRLREILLDDANVYFHEEDHCWLYDVNAAHSRHHKVRCTGFPLLGIGPRWFDECCADGDVFMSFCTRAGSLSRTLNMQSWDFAGGKGRVWPGWAPCWRHEEFPYLTVSDMVDVAAGVRIAARQCFMMETLSSFVFPRLSVQEEQDGGLGVEDDLTEVRFADGAWRQLLGKGKIMGDERWVVGHDGCGHITIFRF